MSEGLGTILTFVLVWIGLAAAWYFKPQVPQVPQNAPNLQASAFEVEIAARGQLQARVIQELKETSHGRSQE